MRARFLVAALLLVATATASAQAPPAEPAAGPELTPIFRSLPSYPREAAAKGTSGFVEFEIIVNPDGTVKKARVTKAEPPGVFETTALRAIVEWRFRPRLVDGKAVESTGTQRIDFIVESNAATLTREKCEAEREPKRASTSISPGFYRRLDKATGVARDGDFAKAEGLARELVASAVTPYEKASASQVLGMALAKLGRTDEAIAAYQVSLDHQALPWVVHDQTVFNIAQFHAVAGRNDLARQVLEQHLRESCAPHPQARALFEKLPAAPAESATPAKPR